MTQFSTSWSPQVTTFDRPYYFQQVSNVGQWQELEQKNFKQTSGFNFRKEDKNLEDVPTWISVSSSENWESGVPLDGKAPLKNVEVKVEDPEGEKNEDGLTFQNNIRLPEIVHKGINIEEELTKQNLYKTELCKSWIESGTCRYGDKCQFAHGPEELRPIYRHPKYKTEVCKTFHNYGTCPYGKRCRFVHHSPNENFPLKELKKKGKKKSKAPKDKENVENLLENETIQKKSEPELKLKKIENELKKNETTLKNVSEIESDNNGIKKNGSSLPFFQKLHKKT